MTAEIPDVGVLAPRRSVRWKVLLPAVPLALFVIVALLGPLLVEYDPTDTALRDRFLPPFSVTTQGTRAWLGTDDLGRDLLAQVVRGAQVSLFVGFFTVAIASAVGVTIGVIAGYKGGWIDSFVMRLADIQLAMPPIILAILLVAALGPSLVNVVIALSSTRWVVYARVARGEILSIKEREFVDSARVLGASPWRLVTKHMLPSAMTPLVVVATVQFGLAIVAESALSFLGLGTPPSTPSWGLTIANGRDYLAIAWWIATIPGIVLSLVVVAAGRLGDKLRDYYDPHQRTLAQ